MFFLRKVFARIHLCRVFYLSYTLGIYNIVLPYLRHYSVFVAKIGEFGGRLDIFFKFFRAKVVPRRVSPLGPISRVSTRTQRAREVYD